MTNNSLSADTCPVNSYNEWDTLEEVIVGRLEGAIIPPYHVTVTYNIPPSTARLYKLFAGRRYPQFLLKKAQKELDEFRQILRDLGITLRITEIIDGYRWFKTPNWRSKGFCTAFPRDGFLVIGKEIIETPLTWRSRSWETDAYRSLFLKYF